MLIVMELNHILNKNAQSSPRVEKTAAHVYMLSRAGARKRRPKGVNYVFISLISGKRNQQKERLSSNQERRKKAEQVESDTKIPCSRQQCSSGKNKKAGIRLTTFKNIVYRELLWNGCHFHARKKFLRKGRKLVPPVRRSTFAQACKLCLLPNQSLYSAGSTDGELVLLYQ